MNGKKQSGLRVLLYIGRFRPRVRPDFGAGLINLIIGSRHTIAGVITVKNDPLSLLVKRLGIPVFIVPSVLDQPLSRARVMLQKSSSRKNLERWLGKLSALKPDIGVIFYGNWIPPDLFNLPARGFINYHPAPLPEFRGVESDTFAVLEGRKKIWGTVHQISNGYDEGKIVCCTRKLTITRYMTPVLVWNMLTKYGIKAIMQALDRFWHNTVVFRRQAHGLATDASRKRAHRESIIRWHSDDSRMLFRRLLAFCGQDIRIRLKADIDGKRFCVRDMEIRCGKFPGKHGDLLGYYKGRGKYHGQPVIRTIDGVVVLKLGAEVRQNMKGPEESMSAVIPPRRRKHLVALSTIRKSILQNA